MTNRTTLFAIAAAAVLASGAADAAAVLETNAANWPTDLGGAGNVLSTTSSGLDLYSTVASYPLAAGISLGFGSDASQYPTLLAPLSGWGLWSGAYAGDILGTVGRSITVTFSSPTSVFGMEVAPDIAMFNDSTNPFAETFTVTLSDGTTTSISGNYSTDANPTQFVGFYGAPQTSITISVRNAADFALGNFSQVPEPASVLLIGGGLLGLRLLRRRAR